MLDKGRLQLTWLRARTAEEHAEEPFGTAAIQAWRELHELNIPATISWLVEEIENLLRHNDELLDELQLARQAGFVMPQQEVGRSESLAGEASWLTG